MSAVSAIEALRKMLAAYDPSVATVATDALARVDAQLHGAYRMVYDNFNATVVGYSADGRASHAVCSVAAYPRWVNLFFFVGPYLPDPHHLLRGTGSTVRSVRLVALGDLDERVLDLLDAAVATWPWPFDPARHISTEIVSVSERRRNRRPR